MDLGIGAAQEEAEHVGDNARVHLGDDLRGVHLPLLQKNTRGTFAFPCEYAGICAACGDNKAVVIWKEK